MNSIRTKTTLLTVAAIVISLTVATLFGVVAIKNIGNQSSEQMLLLLCETGEKNLDSYFESVEQSVEMVSSFIDEDLTELSDRELAEHIDRTRIIFERTANKTHGVLTYYYRIDPEVSGTVKGFWYTFLDGNGFTEHEVTDITKYDTSDTSRLVWFTTPKFTGEPVWLPPYITDNLDVRVISYNVPIYCKGVFVGVVGIEIDYSTMAEQVDNIKLYENGYAFINDAEGNIIYHPRIDVTQLTEENKPKAPNGLISEGTVLRYTYEGVDKLGVWLPLSNGMRLNVSVPVSEINGNWQSLMYEIMIVSVVLLVIFAILAMRLTGHITKPLRKLTEAAEQVNEGNYDFHPDYEGADEVGILTHTFDQLIQHLKVYISDLNSLAYADALTSVRNKGAYNIYVRELQARLDDPEDEVEFAIGAFDCDDLKQINDKYGHDKGDAYLKASSHLICSVFQHSPVFRTGGDEFSVILTNEDYAHREELMRLFNETSTEICSLTEVRWAQVRVAIGVAVYDPKSDRSVNDVARRADKLMYENKRARKAQQKNKSGKAQ